MTANQLTAIRNAEIARNNRELERLRGLELEETKTHNRVSETELRRHQLATENISRDEQMERVRSNMMNEAIGRTNASANVMNAYTNQANARTNAINAQTNRMNAQTSMFDVGIKGINAQISARSLDETKRHNKAVEAETKRYQTAMNDIASQKNEIEKLNSHIRDKEANTNIRALDLEERRMWINAGTTIMNDVAKMALQPKAK